jgi:hypothetical protein
MGHLEETALSRPGREEGHLLCIADSTGDDLVIWLNRESGSVQNGKLVDHLVSTVCTHGARRLVFHCIDELTAVAILAIIKSKNKSFQPSTVVIEQYRPPIDKFIIGIMTLVYNLDSYNTDLLRSTC